MFVLIDERPDLFVALSGPQLSVPLASASMRRARFDGDGKSLADVLEPYVQRPDFLPYDDSPTDARLQPRLILRNRCMWAQLREIQHNLSFRAKTTLDAFHELRKRKGDTWPLDEAQSKDWAETVSTRLRIQARHIQQASLKSPSTAWLRELWQAGRASNT